mmetsp:Transcript_21616/g.55218  ORF Transcript_21616/g.55218 Transcript_21616/m.55218 type:complete len:81 (+) Transcript_21616:71-313(+)
MRARKCNYNVKLLRQNAAVSSGDGDLLVRTPVKRLLLLVRASASLVPLLPYLLLQPPQLLLPQLEAPSHRNSCMRSSGGT